MIRWRFLITRLIVIVAVVVLLRWGLSSVAGYATVRAMQTVTGAKVEIASTRVGFFPPRVQFVDLAVADPRSDKEMRDMISATGIHLSIDGDALLHRRWVAREARITGLQIGTSRQTSGHLPPDQGVGGQGPSMLSRLLTATTDGLDIQADTVVESLETVKRSKEIRRHWEGEISGLVARARSLEEHVRQVSDQASGIENPLRDWPKLEKTIAQSREARNELISVRREIEAMPERLQADLASLEEAKRIDLEKVDRFIPGDLTQASEFGIDMMIDEVRSQVLRVRSYIEQGKSLANYSVVAPEAEQRSRGIKYDLNQAQHPKLMIRQCQIDGVVRADGKLYEMTGIIDNLTTTPELLSEPTRARLRLEGPETLRVEYLRDRRNDADVGLLTLHWPEMAARRIRLGNDRDAAISISGGQHELWVQVRSEGDRIDGRLVSKQTGVEMGLSVDPRFADAPAVVAIRETLDAVDRVEVDANFAGTWNDLDLKVNSNLGQILRRAGRQAIDVPIRQTKERLAALVDATSQQQKLELRRWLESQQSQARSLLASADKSIEEMSQRVLDEVGGADAYLGNLRSPFRR